MSDKKMFKFGDVSSTPHEIIEEIESRGGPVAQWSRVQTK